MARQIHQNKSKTADKYDGDNVPEDFEFPAIGIEDIDRGLFNLFDQDLSIQVVTKSEAKKVPVIFATGERFAYTRRKQPVRDRNNANILPLISILRKSVDISPSQGGKKTAISFRSQENYTIKYRLSENDRNYQNLLNKDNLKNQDNVNSKRSFIDYANKLNVNPDMVGTRRNKNIVYSKNGSINLNQNINNNIYEIIQTAYPYFMTMTYNVTFWAQYMQQANQMIEYFLNRLRVPGAELPFKTKEGFELVAFVKDSINFQNNFDQMTNDERIIKYDFDIVVPGYLINNKIVGAPVQLKSYYSAPMIDFSYISSGDQVGNDYRDEDKKERIERHVLTEVTSEQERKIMTGEEKVYEPVFVRNPFVSDEYNEFLRIQSEDRRTGESVLSGRIIKEIDRQYE